MKSYYLAIGIPVVVFVALLLPLREGFTDDSFIHIQYANNIVTRGEYSFNPGEPSYGTTSPLWVLVHAAVGSAAGGGEGLITVSRVLSWLGGIVAVLLVFVLARALGLCLWMAFLCTLAFGTHAWLLRWTALAMESSTAVAAMTAVGIASLGAFRDPRRAWWLGFSMALASLLRPEAYMLLPLYLGIAVVHRRRVRASCIARTAVIYFSLVLPWLIFAWLHIGDLLPNTAGAKSGDLVLNPLSLLQNIAPIVKIVASAELIPVLLIIIAGVLVKRKSRVFSTDCRLLLLWPIVLSLVFAALDVQVQSRYMLLITPFLFVLGFVSLEEFGRGVLKWTGLRLSVATATVAVVSVFINVFLYSQIIVGPSKAFSHDLTHDLRALGVFIDRSTPRDAVVAAADIGYLGFYSGRRVLDLGGLVENAMGELRSRHSYEKIVKEGLFLNLAGYPRVDYFVDRFLIADRFDGAVINSHHFESVRVARVNNLGIRKPGPFYFTLYRLRPIDNG